MKTQGRCLYKQLIKEKQHVLHPPEGLVHGRLIQELPPARRTQIHLNHQWKWLTKKESSSFWNSCRSQLYVVKTEGYIQDTADYNAKENGKSAKQIKQIFRDTGWSEKDIKG